MFLRGFRPLIAILIGCGLASAALGQQNGDGTTKPGVMRILVKFKPEATVAQTQELQKQVRATYVRPVRGAERTFVIEAPSSAKPLATYKASKLVEHAEVDDIQTFQDIPTPQQQR